MKRGAIVSSNLFQEFIAMGRILFLFLCFSILNLIEIVTPIHILRNEQVRPIGYIKIQQVPSITCIVRGSRPAPIFSWYLDGKNISQGDYDSSYDEDNLRSESTLNKVLSEKEKNMSLECHAYNEAAGIGASDIVIITPTLRSATATLNEQNEPIDGTRVEKVDIDHELSPLKCTVVGSDPAPEVTWFVDDKKVPENDYYTEYVEEIVTATSHFDIFAFIVAKPNSIRCIAKNPHFPEEKYAMIPGFTLPRTDLSEISSVRLKGKPLRCEVEGSRPQPTITWSLAGEPVSNDKYRNIYNSISRKTISYLNYQFIESNYGRYIICTAVNPYKKGTFTNLTKINLEDAQPRVDDIKVLNIYENPLRCEALGTRTMPNFTWFVNSELPNNYTKDRKEISENGAVSSLNIELEEDKKYLITCLAIHPTTGTELENTTDITIPSYPDSEVQFVYIKLQSPLRCVALGSKPPAVISWSIDNEEVPSLHYSLSYNKAMKETVSEFDVLSYMKGSAKSITCWARNLNFPVDMKSATIQTDNLPKSGMHKPSSIYLTDYPLCCEIDGSKPQPNISWNIAGTDIKTDRYKTEYDPVSMATKSCLDMQLLDKKIEKLVHCKAINQYFPDIKLEKSADVKLKNDYKAPDRVYDIESIGVGLSMNLIMCRTTGSAASSAIRWFVNNKEVSGHSEPFSDEIEGRIRTTSTLTEKLEEGKIHFVECMARNEKTGTELWDRRDFFIPQSTKPVAAKPSYGSLFARTLIGKVLDKAGDIFVKSDICEYEKTDDDEDKEEDKEKDKKEDEENPEINRDSTSPVSRVVASLSAGVTTAVPDSFTGLLGGVLIVGGAIMATAVFVENADSGSFEISEEGAKFAAAITKMEMYLKAVELETNYTLAYFDQELQQYNKFEQNYKVAREEFGISVINIGNLPKPNENAESEQIALSRDLAYYQLQMLTTKRNSYALFYFLTGKKGLIKSSLVVTNNLRNDIYAKVKASKKVKGNIRKLLKDFQSFEKFYLNETEKCLSQVIPKYEDYFTAVKDVLVNVGKLVNSFYEHLSANVSSSQVYVDVLSQLYMEQAKQDNLLNSHGQFSTVDESAHDCLATLKGKLENMQFDISISLQDYFV